MTTDEAGGKPLPERILEWLKSQGYPLEMRVARDLRAAGFAVTQSDFYRDPHSSTTWREIDVSARYVRMNREGYGLWSVQYLVECKHPEPHALDSARRRRWTGGPRARVAEDHQQRVCATS